MEIGASMQGAGGLGSGKLRVTTERLIFERKKMFGGGGDVSSFALASIQQAGISGLLDEKLKVRAGSTELVFASSIGSSSDADLKAISTSLQRAIAGEPLGTPNQSPDTQAKAPEALPAAHSEAAGDWMDGLERLARLHEAGALDDDEFAAAKRKLLDR